MRRDILIVGTIIVLLALMGVANVVKSTIENRNNAGGGTVCTMDAKQCPDGSYVGRTGPKCEFAACPTPTATTSPVTLTIHLGETATAAGVSINPTKILEDSRCPQDVTCIQAGTVRIQTTLAAGMGAAPQEFKLGQPITTEAETVTLTDVTPARRANVTIAPADYTFTFSIAKRTGTGGGGGGGIAPYQSGVSGVVLLGPTCPVQRIPPDPKCADKPYATQISVTRTNSSSVFATASSDANGMFRISLPPGSYTVTARGGSMLPRCPSQTVTVGATGYAPVTILCDTGIR